MCQRFYPGTPAGIPECVRGSVWVRQHVGGGSFCRHLLMPGPMQTLCMEII